MATKSARRSKTIWVNILLAVITIFSLQIFPAHIVWIAQWSPTICAIANIILRIFFTYEGITPVIKKSGMLS